MTLTVLSDTYAFPPLVSCEFGLAGCSYEEYVFTDSPCAQRLGPAVAKPVGAEVSKRAAALPSATLAIRAATASAEPRIARRADSRGGDVVTVGSSLDADGLVHALLEGQDIDVGEAAAEIFLFGGGEARDHAEERNEGDDEVGEEHFECQ